MSREEGKTKRSWSIRTCGCAILGDGKRDLEADSAEKRHSSSFCKD